MNNNNKNTIVHHSHLHLLILNTIQIRHGQFRIARAISQKSTQIEDFLTTVKHFSHDAAQRENITTSSMDDNGRYFELMVEIQINMIIMTYSSKQG